MQVEDEIQTVREPDHENNALQHHQYLYAELTNHQVRRPFQTDEDNLFRFIIRQKSNFI